MRGTEGGRGGVRGLDKLQYVWEQLSGYNCSQALPWIIASLGTRLAIILHSGYPDNTSEYET